MAEARQKRQRLWFVDFEGVIQGETARWSAAMFATAMSPAFRAISPSRMPTSTPSRSPAGMARMQSSWWPAEDSLTPFSARRDVRLPRQPDRSAASRSRARTPHAPAAISALRPRGDLEHFVKAAEANQRQDLEGLRVAAHERRVVRPARIAMAPWASIAAA